VPAINWGRELATMRARFAGRVAVEDAQGSASYAEVIDRAAGLARALLGAGVGPGSRVATVARNGRLAPSISYGVMLAGAAEVPLNIAYTEAEFRDALAIAGVGTVVCAAEHAALFRDAGCRVFEIGAIAPTRLDPAALPDVGAALAGRIGFTSGTTGRPKAIVTSQAARWAGHVLLQASLPWLPEAGARCLLMTPFAHGASLQTYAWLSQGGTVVLHDGVDPDRVRPLLAGGLEAMFAAPTVLAKLAAGFAGAELPGLRTIFTGTAPLPPLLYGRVRAMFGPVVRVTYGKTEVVNPIAILRPEETEEWYAEGGGADGAACVGWPGQGVEIVLGAGDEVLLRARHMSEGTLDAELNVVPWRADGFHPTGDVGRFDERGRLHLVARLSDAMKSGGYKIYPQEIERALAPAGEAVVVGFPSEYWGEVIVAVAETPDEGWAAAARAACSDLAPFKRPRLYAGVAAFPRNGQGKVVRRVLLAELFRNWRLVDGPRPVFERIG
jgi:acyl-CoA synthetase (AMP-forming)/AMP-acid ligase II